VRCEECGSSEHRTEDCPIPEVARLINAGLYYEEGDEIVLLDPEDATLFTEGR
jgi:hypothetical protein